MSVGGLWNARTPRERVLIILGVVVLLVAGYLVVVPQEANKAGMLASSLARKRYIEELQRKRDADAKLAELKPKLDTIAYKETSEKVIPLVLKTLHEHAAKAGVHLRELKPLRPRQMGDATKVSLTVRFTGVFSQVIPFVYYLEDPQGKLVVEKLNVSSPDPKSRQVDVEVQVALFTVEAAGAPGGKKS